ncbi:EAL domain-containing protein [Azonexus sp. IMCC34842]|uniref:bifunctional diguanylate cyclase/phosphodiesterase n=1 Tax=Azonexus sp. IMCC34842 TaxID=3420950 RepID=UPI003D0F9E4D
MNNPRLSRFALLTFLLAIVLTGILYRNFLDSERANTRLDFEQAATIRINALRAEAKGTIELLRLLSAHLELVQGGTAKGFSHYTQAMLDQHPYLQAVGYNPRVTLAERHRFEQAARAELPDFTINDTLQPGSFARAEERSEYFPFLYVEPLAANKPASGFDVATETTPSPLSPRRTAMRAATDGNTIAVTSPLTLALKKTSGQTGVIVFSPLYRTGRIHAENFFGFATLVIRVSDMLLWSQRVASERGGKDVELVLQDCTGPATFAMHGSLPASLPELRREELIDIPGGRQWRVTALPVKNAFSLAPKSGALSLLAVGSALSLLLGILVQILAGRSQAIRLQVNERTADLATANDKLLQEVDRRMSSENRLRQVSALQRSVLANAGYAIVATNNEGIIQVFNPAAERILGYPAKAVINRLRPSFFHQQEGQPDEDGAHFRAIVAPLAELPAGSSFDQELTFWPHSGQPIPVKLSLSVMLDEDGKQVGYMGIAYDISSQKAAEAHITRLAHFDTLTGLPNRLQLRKELRRAIAAAKRSGQRLGVMFVDLDRFKNINDSLGHFVGDALLQSVSKRLQGCLREGDVIARMGGDEFVILLDHISTPEIGAEVAERILEQVSMPIAIQGHTLTITPSIGIALYPDDGADSDSLIQNADTAMYSAKESGRNAYCYFTRSMNERVSSRLNMESRIRHALKESLFFLDYQPQFDAITGRLTGAEALVRMRGAEGVLPPDCFIPVAEDSGLILPLGDWVLAEAARRNRAWIDAGWQPVPIAVNVSARQFEQPDFPEKVRAALARADLDPCWLDIELTESTIMQSVDKTLEALNALKLQGLRIVIDDFGTGFSSLAYLKRFPIDCLKIDRSFVEDLERGSEGNCIVQAIISLARQLSLQVVAEGVETAGQLELLQHWGCTTIQGYLLGRPMDATSFEALLERR